MYVPGTARTSRLIEQLDFIYMPTTDAARDLGFYRDVLGAEIVFAIEAFGTRVAMVRLSPAPPRVLLAGHLEGERPILVYRVGDLDRATEDLEGRGCSLGEPFGIPHGEGRTITTTGGHRLAIYELTRPGADERLAGRRDF
jgi:catechol 2,3-dioxygenase-like lactoylglutathione lyase family enzyme